MVLLELPDDIKNEVMQALQQQQQNRKSATSSMTSDVNNEQPGCSHWPDNSTRTTSPKLKMMSLKQVRVTCDAS